MKNTFIYFKHFIFLSLLMLGCIFTTSVNAQDLTLTPPENLTAQFDTTNETIKLSWKKDANVDYYIIYRSLTGKNDFTYYEDTYYGESEFIDDDVSYGVPYYYRVVAYSQMDVYNEEYDYYDWQDVYSEPASTGKIIMPLKKPELKSVKSEKGHKMQITWKEVEHADGYHIYRSTNTSSNFKYIGKYESSYSSWSWWDDEDDDVLSYTDKKLTMGITYYYKVCPYVIFDGKKYFGTSSLVKGDVSRIDSAVISKAVSKKKKTNKITWKKVSGADGYYVYYSKKYNGKYKKLKTLKGNKKLSYTHKKLKNGVAYYYKVYAYKNINGKAYASNEPEPYEKYCDYYTYEYEPYSKRYERIYGKKGNYKYTTSKQASKHMKTIKIKVWDINSKGKKYTRSFKIRVNKGLAPSIKQMFKEIYKSKEKFPIHSIGCYEWRGNGSSSEHCLGTAFDINADENYMTDNGKISAGSLWKPSKNPYSIPLKCKLVSILEKYGFSRGFWGSRKDYMHFSYFGT